MLALFASVALGADELKPVVKVNSTVLDEFHLKDVMNELLPSAAFHGTVSPDTVARYRPKAVDMLIEKELLYQEARRLGIKADAKKLDDMVEKVVERTGGQRNFKAALKAEGITEKEYTENIRRNLTVTAYEEQEIREKSVASDEEIKATYERNRDGYKRPEARKLSHILIAVEPSATEDEIELRRKRAQEVLDKVRAGEDFGVVAWDYSDDPFRIKGGDMGMIHKGRLDEDLEKVAFGLKSGEVSGLVRTIYGFHIIRVDGVYEPVQLSLDEVSQTIRAKIEDERRKALKESTLKKLREKAVIEVY